MLSFGLRFIRAFALREKAQKRITRVPTEAIYFVVNLWTGNCPSFAVHLLCLCLCLCPSFFLFGRVGEADSQGLACMGGETSFENFPFVHSCYLLRAQTPGKKTIAWNAVQQQRSVLAFYSKHSRKSKWLVRSVKTQRVMLQSKIPPNATNRRTAQVFGLAPPPVQCLVKRRANNITISPPLPFLFCRLWVSTCWTTTPM